MPIFIYSDVVRLLISIAFSLAIAGCAVSGPIVDMSNVNPANYHADLDECRGYAGEVSTGQQVVAGAASSAVIWGAIGAIYRGSEGARKGSASGAVWGGARGAGKAAHERSKVVKSCLRYRGYAVLN